MIHRQPGFEAPPADRDSGNTLGEARRYMSSADRNERAIRYGGCPEGAVSQLGPPAGPDQAGAATGDGFTGPDSARSAPRARQRAIREQRIAQTPNAARPPGGGSCTY